MCIRKLSGSWKLTKERRGLLIAPLYTPPVEKNKLSAVFSTSSAIWIPDTATTLIQGCTISSTIIPVINYIFTGFQLNVFSDNRIWYFGHYDYVGFISSLWWPKALINEITRHKACEDITDYQHLKSFQYINPSDDIQILPRPFLLSFLLPFWRTVRSYPPYLEASDPICGDDWSQSLYQTVF